MAAQDMDDDLSTLNEVVDDAPIVKLANLLIKQAIQDRASDIHIEPGERDVRVRYRIDGVLHEVMRPPKGVQAGLISRLKIMADMNIAEKRVPQDGRISANFVVPQPQCSTGPSTGLPADRDPTRSQAGTARRLRRSEIASPCVQL